MIHLGNSKYITLGIINRLNRDPKDTPFLYNLRKVLREALLLDDKNKFSPEALYKKFGNKKWVKNVDPNQPMIYSGVITPKAYLVIQDILYKETGKIWPMNKFLDMIIFWFIYCYENDKELPIKRKKLNIINLIKFHRRFKRYYKNNISI